MELQINYLAVLVVAIISFVLGGLWYGPIFGKKWLVLSGITPQVIAEAKAKGGMGKMMTKNYIFTFIGAFLMASVLAHIIGYASGFMQQSGAIIGIEGAFWLWLGFVAPVTLSKVLWEGKSFQLWILDNAYYLISLLLMGSILASWM